MGEKRSAHFYIRSLVLGVVVLSSHAWGYPNLVKPPPEGDNGHGVQVADRKSRKADSVDLNQLTTTPDPKTKEPYMGAKEPRLSAMFDILLARQPGRANLSFLNFHPLLFMEFVPTPEFNFSFEVNPRPRFFELTYQASPWWNVKAGKVRIPFDDYEYHNTFGGFINTSRMKLGNVAFLPDIWADLGIATKIMLADNNDLLLDAYGYVVNGFGSGGTDPIGVQTAYPNFGPEIPINVSDNNDDKSVGGRVHGVLYRTFGLGASAYSGRWSDEGQSSQRVFMYGVDGQVFLGRTTIRLGYVNMKVGLADASGDIKRIGGYAEASYRFGDKDQFRVLGRGGYLDPDDRTTDENDLVTLGGSVSYRYKLAEYSILHNQDMKKLDVKRGYSFTGLRVVIRL